MGLVNKELVEVALTSVVDYCTVLLVVEEHDEETFEGTTGLPSQFSCFVEKLPTCMSKQMVDEVSKYL